MRARTDTAVSDVTQLRPADITGPVRVVVSSKKAFAIRGVCVDAAGLPIRHAKVEVSFSWMLGPRGVGSRGGSCETVADEQKAVRRLLDRDESRRTHVYRPRVPAEKTQRQLVVHLLERVFEGSTLKLVMQALSASKVSTEEMSQIRALLDEMEGRSS